MSLSSHFRKLIPAFNRILVQKIEPVKANNIGIILSTKEVTGNIGRIVAVGEGMRGENGELNPVPFKVGSVILLPEYGGSKIELKDGEFYVYRDNEIVGVLEEPVN